MREIIGTFLLVFISVGAAAQDQAQPPEVQKIMDDMNAMGDKYMPKPEPKVFDAKFWLVTGSLIGAQVFLAESMKAKYPEDSRLVAYTTYGLMDIIIIPVTANWKSDQHWWWWVLPVGISVYYNSMAVHYQFQLRSP